MQTKFSQTMMAYRCESCESDVMPLNFFREGLRFNSDAYVELLITAVKPWIPRLANGRPYAWQQDSAPCHTSGKSKKWLSVNFYDYTSPNVWPPNSKNLNHMDYYIWGTVEKDANHRASTAKAQLINRFKTVFETIPRNV